MIIIPAIIINILAITILTIGLFYNFKQPKNKAIYGYFVAGSMLLYIITLGFVTLYEMVAKYNLYSLVLFLCLISPFVIGKLVKYKTLKKYTVIQIFCYIVSFFILLLIF